MDSRDQISIAHLKSLNLKNSFQQDLTEKIRIATQDWTKNIYIHQFADIASEYAYEMCKEFKDKSDFITPAIRDYLINEVCDALQDRTPEFKHVRQDVLERVRRRI
jgi:hypothetical protein